MATAAKPEIYARTRDAIPKYTANICLPLAKGEVVIAAWIRELDNGLCIRDPVLVLCTSFQPTCTFGPYVPADRQRQYQYKPLVEQDGSRITGFCHSDNGTLSSRQTSIGVTHEENRTGPMYFSSGETELGPYTKIVCNSEKEQGWREIPRAAQVVWWFIANCLQLDVHTT